MAATLEIVLPPLHPSQRAVGHHPARFRVLACGRRWGKTTLGAVLCVASAIQAGRAWWVAPDYKRADEGWIRIKWLTRQVPGTRVGEADRRASFPGGGRLDVRSADDPNSLRGAGLDLVVIDEAAFVSEGAWSESLRPALTDRQGRAVLISTPAGRNWFWRAWQRGLEGNRDWQSWQLPTADNPHIDPAEIEAARAELPERVFNQEYLADFSVNEGVFFPEWSERRHVVPPFDVPADWVRWIAYDYGFADPFCALWFARSPDKARVVTYRELYLRGVRAEEQGELIRQHSGRERISRIYADPSVFNRRTEANQPSIAQMTGLPLLPAPNRRIDGWQVVRRDLAGDPPRWQVFGTCRNLIRTMPEMVHDPLNVEDLADRIGTVKTEDHAADCARYGLAAEAIPPSGPGRVADFEFGD